MAKYTFPFGSIELSVTGTTATVDDTATLGTSTTIVPSQRAVKVYVDTGLSTKQNLIDSSAVLAAAIGDETGSGVAVFATTPTLVTPILGVATATSINKVTITAPATSSTLTIANGSSLITSGAYSITFTAGATTTVTLPASGTLATLAGSETLSNKTLTTPVLGAATATSITCTAISKIGTHDWGVGSTGITVSASDPVFQVAGKIASASVTAGAYASSYSQFALTKTQATGVSMFASWNELYITSTGGAITLTGSGNYAAVWGHVEVSGASIVTSSTGNIAALNGSLIIPANFVNNGLIAGCQVDAILGTGFTNTGNTAAFAIGTHLDPGQDDWEYGLYIPASTVTTGISIVGSTKGMSVVSTLTGTGNLDANTITVTDNTTAGAFCRGFAVGVTAAGTKTGSGEVDGIGIDMTYTGNTTYGYNLSLYGAGSGNPTLGFVSNISIYQDNLGTAVSGYAAIDIGIALSDAPSYRYTYFRCRDHSSAIPISVFKFEGAHCATNFFSVLNSDGTPDFLISAAVSSTQNKKIRVDVNGTPYYIPLYVA